MNYMGIEKKKLAKVGKQLNILLATYSVYYQNLRSFHWHIRGSSFFDIHELFEEMYNDAKLKIDDLAERILTINQKPLGSMEDYLRISKINEAKDNMPDVNMVAVVLENHRILISIMRKAIKIASEINDEGTVDVMSGFLSSIEKTSWMLSAWKNKQAIKIEASR